MKYKVKKHGKKITLTSEGIDITYKEKEPVELGEVDLDENDLDNIDIRIKGKGFKIKKKTKML